MKGKNKISTSFVHTPSILPVPVVSLKHQANVATQVSSQFPNFPPHDLDFGNAEISKYRRSVISKEHAEVRVLAKKKKKKIC